jgi:hypothetical protein
VLNRTVHNEQGEMPVAGEKSANTVVQKRDDERAFLVPGLKALRRAKKKN